MTSLLEAFLSHDTKAYPCGEVIKSRKMLSELPAFRDVVFISSKTKLRTTLTKGTPRPQANVGEYGK